MNCKICNKSITQNNKKGICWNCQISTKCKQCGKIKSTFDSEFCFTCTFPKYETCIKCGSNLKRGRRICDKCTQTNKTCDTCGNLYRKVCKFCHKCKICGLQFDNTKAKTCDTCKNKIEKQRNRVSEIYTENQIEVIRKYILENGRQEACNNLGVTYHQTYAIYPENIPNNTILKTYEKRAMIAKERFSKNPILIDNLLASSRGFNYKTQRTDIERFTAKILDKYKVEYEEQYMISSRTFVDFKIKNLILEINGDYWHCNPKIYKTPINSIQIKQIEKDKKRITRLKNLGFNVEIIWESDLTESYLVSILKNHKLII